MGGLKHRTQNGRLLSPIPVSPVKRRDEMNYPNDAYYRQGFRRGIVLGMEYQRRFAVAAKQFSDATGAGVSIALSRGNVPFAEVAAFSTVSGDQARIDELHRFVWSSVIFTGEMEEGQ